MENPIYLGEPIYEPLELTFEEEMDLARQRQFLNEPYHPLRCYDENMDFEEVEYNSEIHEKVFNDSFETCIDPFEIVFK